MITRQRGIGTRGFTLVELLIVIVVIAILAAITLISYGNVTKKANDASVQSDLANLNNDLQAWKAENGAFPSTDIQEFQSRGVRVNQAAYDTTIAYNIVYCYKSSVDSYIIVAQSKSGNIYAVSDQFGVKAMSASTYDGLGDMSHTSCGDIISGYARIYSGYDRDNSYNGTIPGDTAPWRLWVTTQNGSI